MITDAGTLGLQALRVEAAATLEHALDEIRDGDRTLASGSLCQVCAMGFRTAAALVLTEVGELDQVSRRLDEAERIAAMWNGGPWIAALWEARGVLRRAQGNEPRALAAFGEAAARFAELGRVLDHGRCVRRMNDAPGQANA